MKYKNAAKTTLLIKPAVNKSIRSMTSEPTRNETASIEVEEGEGIPQRAKTETVANRVFPDLGRIDFF